MPHAFNGTGTMYYGKAFPETDGSYVVTEWITLLWLPILPLGSKRVWFQSAEYMRWGNQSTTNYKVLAVPLHLPHIVKGYAFTLAVCGTVTALDPHSRYEIKEFFRQLLR
ncbi:MAG: hypothetical protein EPO06_06400 [Burkholderiaceae bacterium]|nr:MAG: hypothetical protein EPO06_06400 [Burkholderiaceae bacterium]